MISDLVRCLSVLMVALLLAAPAWADEIEGKPILPTRILRNGHTGAVSGMVWGEAEWLFSAGLDGRLIAWDTSSGRIRWKAQAGNPSLLSVALVPGGCCLLVGGERGFLALFDARSGNRLPDAFEQPRPFAGSIHSIDFHPDSRSFVTGDTNGYVDFWQLGLPAPLFSEHAHEWPVKWVRFSRTGDFVLSSDPGQVLLWNARTGSRVADLSTFDGHLAPGAFWFHALDFSRTEDALIVANSEGIFVYDLATRTVVKSIPPGPVAGNEDGRINAVALSADRRHLLATGGSAGFLVFDLESGTPVRGFVDFSLQLGFMTGLAHHPVISNRIAVSRVNAVPNVFTGSLKVSHVINVYGYDPFD